MPLSPAKSRHEGNWLHFNSQSGQLQLITFKVQMPVPCYVYTKVQKKNYVWKIEGRCKRDHKMTVYNAIIET